MNQPPKHEPPAPWRRPVGVAPGTWDYVNQRSIADHYDAFVADTPLCELDEQILSRWLPGTIADDMTPQDEPLTVLDLGCGTGRTAIPLAERGYDVVGIDLSRAMLESLLEKAAASDRTMPGNVTGLHANLVQLDCLADNVADHAVCMFSTLGMIQGRPHRRKLLRHVARAVRKDGLLVLHVHNRWAAITEPGGLTHLIRSRLRSLTSDTEFGDSTYRYRGIESMFMHRFSRRELKRDLSASGWRVETIEAISVDGSKTIGGIGKGFRAGGFIVVARSI